ncbi:MAG: hypothetical protein AAGA54_12465 [Myxococcota bacterium]
MNNDFVRPLAFVLSLAPLGCIGGDTVDTGVIDEFYTSGGFYTSTGAAPSSTTPPPDEPDGTTSAVSSTGPAPTTSATGGSSSSTSPTGETDGGSTSGASESSGGTASSGEVPVDPCTTGVPAAELCAALAQPWGACGMTPLFTALQCEAKLEAADDPACRGALLEELACLVATACEAAPEDACAAEIEAFDEHC